ncbi:MAG: folate-binding protein YgfZ [Gemmatimonadetes bacterium]|nr:folate-binding protein YgfZ [Gemmatimonadota bacterium]
MTLPTLDAHVVRRTDLVRIAFTGPQAATVVNGLVTNDVVALGAGQGCYAVALTPKGKIVADLRIYRTDDAVLTDTTIEAAEGWKALVRKFVNPRLSKYTDQTPTLGFFELYGARVGDRLAALGATWTADYAHGAVTLDGVEAGIARLPGIGTQPGAVVWCPSESAAAVGETLQRTGISEGSVDGLEAWRVEGGRPRWGIDMDDTMLAQEANMDDLHAISYTKGCYTGQEFVARLHYRGHVNRYLRGLRLDASVPRGASVVHGDGAIVGDVRSCAVSAQAGPLALALVRREVPDGATVRVRTGDAEVGATVIPLPFNR